MGSQLISCTGLLLARIHEITAADYSCTFALLARRPLLNSFAVPAYVRLVIRHVVLWLLPASALLLDRKSTRLNSSHRTISYAVFCLKKKKLINVSRSARTLATLVFIRARGWAV